jgi:hypothetical protein
MRAGGEPDRRLAFSRKLAQDGRGVLKGYSVSERRHARAGVWSCCPWSGVVDACGLSELRPCLFGYLKNALEERIC